MMCDKCKVKPATVHVTQKIKRTPGDTFGSEMAHHFCEACSREFMQNSPDFKETSFSKPTLHVELHHSPDPNSPELDRPVTNSDSGDPEVVRRLFEEHVPPIASGAIEIRGIVRQPGQRSILAVASKDPAIDAVGACVGNRGSLVKLLISKLAGEKIDLVLWSEPAERFIANLLAPSRFTQASFDEATRQVTIVLAHDSTQPAPDKLALRSKLLLQLTGWNLKVELPGER